MRPACYGCWSGEKGLTNVTGYIFEGVFYFYSFTSAFLLKIDMGRGKEELGEGEIVSIGNQ